MIMDLCIRKMESRDLCDTRNILRETWRQTYSDSEFLDSMYKLLEDESLSFLLPNAGETALIAVHTEQPAGVLVLRRIRDVVHVLALYILPRFQRRGVGRELLRYAISDMQAPIILEARVKTTSVGAVSFYHSFGFAKTERRVLDTTNGRFAEFFIMRLEMATVEDICLSFKLPGLRAWRPQSVAHKSESK